MRDAEPGRWIAALLHASDSFYPTGAYAHSFGLEGLVQENVVRDRETLRAFLLESVLPSLARTDLAVAEHAGCAPSETPVNWTHLHGLSLLASSLRGASEPREAAEAIGRQRLDLASMLHGGLAAEFNRRALAENWPRPACIAAAIEGRAIGAPCEAVLAAIVYSTSAGILAAAVKLLRLGQNAVHTLLAEALAQTPRLIEEALVLPLDEIGAFNPWWDIAAARHERAEFRLFIS
jgi:urease accessory protein